MKKNRKTMAAKLVLFAALLLAATLANAQAVTISGGPDASTLTTSLSGAYNLAVGIGLSTLGVGFVVYMIKKGVRVRA